MKDHITIKGEDGAWGAYIAPPKDLPAPAVVVLHEVFGVNADIRKTCDEMAEQGFLAIAPDLFWRQEPGVDLGVTSESDWQHGLRLYQAFDREAGAKDVKSTVEFVTRLPECTGKVAVMGFCLGGLMTFLTAVRYGVDAAVVYHGGDTEKYLDELNGLLGPMIMHLGEEDESSPSPRKLKSKWRLQTSRTRLSTATRVSITPSLAIMGHTTMPRQHRLRTSGQGHFYLCGNLKS